MADSAVSTANTSVESLDTFDTPTTTPIEQVVDPQFAAAAASSHSTSLAGLRGAITPSEQADKVTSLPIAIAGTASIPEEITLAQLASSSSSSLPIVSSSSSSISDLSPSFLLVASLRSQITDLTSQVTSLNSKLVKGYTRIGDLEDELHETTQEGGRLKGKLGELEKDKSVLESEIEGGGWVEKDHVQGEMQRLMAKVLEETKSRESAVQAHDALQEEIDNLTSSLFTEANRMVAVERFARARAEEKMKSLEESAGVMDGLFGELQVNLREKVEAWEEKDGEVGALRQQITNLINAGSNGEAMVNGNGNHGDDDTIPHDGVGGVLFSDGNHVTAASNALAMALASPLLPGAASPSLSHSRNTQPVSLLPPRLLTTVLPYQEFLSFISYLRHLRVNVLSKPIEPSGFPQAYATASSSRTTSTHSTSHSLPNNHVTSPPPPPSPAQLLSSHLPLSSHLSQPFLKRCIMEDSDPTLRLDLAPSLGFLSRRNVQTAILDGTLLIEPSSYNAPLPGSSCAMCGVGLERYWRGEGELKLSSQVGNEGSTSGSTAKNVGGTVMKVLGGKGGWGLSSFTGGSSRTSSISTLASVGSSAAGGSSGPSSPITATFPTTTAPPLGLGMNFPPSTPTPGTQTPQDPNNPFSFYNPTAQQIHIFRTTETSHSRYAICPTYCLPRLRGVCEFWNYVRVMERGLLLEEGFRFVAGRGRGKSELEREERRREKEVKADEEELESELEVEEEKVEPKVEGVEEVLAEETPAGEPDVEAEKDVLEVTTVENNSTLQSEVPAPVEGNEPTATLVTPIVETVSPIPDLTPIQIVPSSPLRLSTGKAGAPLIPRRSGARPTTPNLSQNVESFSSTASSPQTANAVTPTQASPQRPKLPPRHIGRLKTPGGSGGNASGTNGMTPGPSGNIVADAVGWEDRCWTEVVRLKESLFWTRVAGVGEGGEQVSGRGARVEAL